MALRTRLHTGTCPIISNFLFTTYHQRTRLNHAAVEKLITAEVTFAVDAHTESHLSRSLRAIIAPGLGQDNRGTVNDL